MIFAMIIYFGIDVQHTFSNVITLIACYVSGDFNVKLGSIDLYQWN